VGAIILKISEDFTQTNSKSSVNDTTGQDFSVDLSWIDLLKGIAIIGVFLDNWNSYMIFEKTPDVLYSFANAFWLAVSTSVQVFFILSGFGLTISYFKQSKNGWSWKRWAWRRFTKIVIPYEIAVVFSFILGMIGSYIYESSHLQFSFPAFLAHVTFAQNFYPQSHVWNNPLWFMPVIIGLYIVFPVLLKILTKFGPWMLLIISLLITYGTLVVTVLTGLYQGHGTDFFTFWMFQFTLGMTLAYIRETKPERLRLLIGSLSLLVGIGLMMSSWALRTYIPLGNVFNDAMTSMGIFPILLNLVWVGRSLMPMIGKILLALSVQSFLMYLTHYPIMAFLIGPPLRVPTNPIMLMTLCIVYIAIIFLLSKFISQPINRITNWVYYKYQGSRKAGEQATGQ
jgi:peptidoglycan/LPS O-acetylase OafA/YrhL